MITSIHDLRDLFCQTSFVQIFFSLSLALVPRIVFHPFLLFFARNSFSRLTVTQYVMFNFAIFCLLSSSFPIKSTE